PLETSCFGCHIFRLLSIGVTNLRQMNAMAKTAMTSKATNKATVKTLTITMSIPRLINTADIARIAIQIILFPSYVAWQKNTKCENHRGGLRQGMSFFKIFCGIRMVEY